MRTTLAFVALAILTAGATHAQVPTVADGGVLNGASFVKGQGVAPGSLVSLFGSELASSLAQADTVPLSTLIGDVSVSFNGINAPLYFVSPGQVNAQVPWELDAGASVNVVVSRGSAASKPAAVQLAAMAPGLFMIPGGTQAIAINADGTIAAAAGAIVGLTTHAAKPGDVIILYATGLGPVTPTIESGHDSLDQLRKTVNTPVISIGGVTASILFSGLTPQFPGVNQVNVIVPSGVAPGGSVPLQIQLGGISQQATIAVSQ